jgi:hypothetical protein
MRPAGAGRSPADKGHGWPALTRVRPPDHGGGGLSAARPVPGPGAPPPAGPPHEVAVGPAARVSQAADIILPADPALLAPVVQELPPSFHRVNLTLPRELIA